MEEKKIITIEEELRMLIGLAANQICDSHDESEDLIIDVAGDICIKVNDHLTGRKKFSEEDITRYKTIKAMLDLAEKIPGVVII